MQDLMMELTKMKSELRQAMGNLRKNGDTLAQAEHDYQVKKAQVWRTPKADGWTATDLNATIKGQPEVAEALFVRDTAKVLYESNQEYINVVKLEIKVLENQIRREWGADGTA